MTDQPQVYGQTRTPLVEPHLTKHFLLILACAFAHFLTMSSTFHLPRWVLALGGTEIDAGLVVSVSILPVVILSPLATQWVAQGRIGFRALVTGAAVGVFVTTALMMTVTDVSAWLYTLRILQTVAHALMFSPLFFAAVTLVDNTRKAQGIAYFVVAVQLGNMVGSSLSGLILEHYSTQAYLVAAAVASLLAVVPVLLVRWEPPTAMAATSGTAPTKSPGVLAVLRRPIASAGIMTVVILGGVYCALFQFIPSYFDELLAQQLIAQPISSVFFLAPGFLTLVVIRLSIGTLADGRYRYQAMMATFVLTLIGILMVMHIESWWFAVASAVVFGIGYGVLYPAVNGFVIRENEAGAHGILTGFLSTGFQVGYYAFALGLGPLYTVFGYRGTYALTATLLAAVWLWFLVASGNARAWLVPEPEAAPK